MLTLKNYTYFHQLVDYHKIHKLFYRSQFTKIIIHKIDLLHLSCSSSNQEVFKNIAHLIIKGDNLYKWPIRMVEHCWNKCLNIRPKLFIPPSVTHLTFGGDFNEDIHGIIPNSVTHLTFGDCFNQSVLGNIPDSVTHLAFGFSFNQELRNLKIDWKHPLDKPAKSIPKNVTHLRFGDQFNQCIFGCIPNGVTHLTFGQNFDQDISGCIPVTVTHLIYPHLTYPRFFYYPRGHVYDAIPHNVLFLNSKLIG